MRNYTLLIILLVAVCLSLVNLNDAWTQTSEEITITTYYPSPYGVYNTLTLFPNDDHTPGGACLNAERGQMYYDNTGAGSNQAYICDGNNWVTLGIGTGFSNFQVFDNDGTFTIPNNVTRIMVEVWGGGGGASGNGGGGGGGYGKDIFIVVPGTQYIIIVGAGGLGIAGVAVAGGTGGTSSFGALINATGGLGGGITWGVSIGGISNAAINVSGGFGGYSGAGTLGGMGGNGGSGGIGYLDTTSFPAAIRNGMFPGGGGGSSGDVAAGGDGAQGRVIVWW